MRAALRLAALALALALAACGPKASGPPPEDLGTGIEDERVRQGGWDDALVDDLLAALRGEVGCSTPPGSPQHRFWCLAADGWATGTAAALPDRALYVGLTLSLAEGDPVDDWLDKGVHFSALGLRKDGDTHLARIAPIVPDNQAEQALVQPAEASARAVFKGEAKAVALPAELADYLKDLPDAASYALTKGDKGWTWKGASESQLRQAGPYWIAIEVPPEGPRGILVSIFTDRIE